MKMLFILIVECFHTLLNLIPKVSASLASPQCQACLEIMHIKCLVRNLVLRRHLKHISCIHRHRIRRVRDRRGTSGWIVSLFDRGSLRLRVGQGFAQIHLRSRDETRTRSF